VDSKQRFFKQRIFITGGSGFIGSHLIRRLVEAGHTVRNYDPRVNPAEDILNLPKLTEAIGEFEPDLIYHLASLVGVGPTERVPGYVIRVNMEGVLNLVGALASRDLHPGIVFTSSSEVYGKNPNHGAMREDDPKVPISFYGSGKLACEAILQAYKNEGLMRPTIVRLFNVYGPRQALEFVVTKFISALLRDQPPIVHRQGFQTRCFTYIDDLVDGLVKAGRYTLSPEYETGPNVFNLGNTEEIKIRDLALYLCATINPAIEPFFMDGADDRSAERDPDRRIPDVSRAREWLMWQPRTSWFLGMHKTVEWAREQAAALLAKEGNGVHLHNGHAKSTDKGNGMPLHNGHAKPTEEGNGVHRHNGHTHGGPIRLPNVNTMPATKRKRAAAKR
jgi:UDP-glucose 4-epimerase